MSKKIAPKKSATKTTAAKPVAKAAKPVAKMAPKVAASKVSAPKAQPAAQAAAQPVAQPVTSAAPFTSPKTPKSFLSKVIPSVLLADFIEGDHAVYPGHGVGEVVAVETKEILGSKQTFYSIRILETGMKIMVPKDNAQSVGLRPIVSKTEAAKVIEILKETNVKIDNQTWNRRYRDYMEKIKTGSVYEIAEVLRDLFLLKVDKELSFGERKMLDTARNLLLRELSLATSTEEMKKQEDIAAIFGL